MDFQLENFDIDMGDAAQLPAQSSDIPEWYISLMQDFDDRLFNGFVISGNTEDLCPLDGELLKVEEFLTKTLPQKEIILLDPAVGVTVLAGGEALDAVYPKGWQDLPLYEALLELYKARFLIFPAVILLGCKLWLGKNTEGRKCSFLIKRLVETSAQQEIRPLILAISESHMDLSTDLTNSQYFKRLELPFPSVDQLASVLSTYQKQSPELFKELQLGIKEAAERISGTGIHALVNTLKRKASKKESLSLHSLEGVKQQLVEETCGHLIEFVVPDHNLDVIYGQEHLKKIIRRDISIWEAGDLHIMPKGYLLIGPVGTGKSFFVDALGGEANVPVVKLNNFRSPEPGETEANLERIFRLLKSLTRCYVFIDEADQAMGARLSGSDGSSGRVYSMFAQEIASERNRGKLIWIMATSQPQKLEPDLKRPGRMDLKIPLLPCENKRVAWALIEAMGKAHGLQLGSPKVDSGDFSTIQTVKGEDKYIEAAIPEYVTPAAAVVIVGEIARKKRDNPKISDRALLMDALRDYQPMIPPIVMKEQTRLAVKESSDLRFIPIEFQPLLAAEKPFIVL